jgi:putative transposase
MSSTKKRQKIDKTHPRLSLQKQCELVSIHRSSIYYQPKGESVLNQELMKEIDKYFLEHPYYGVERMTAYLNMDLGYNVNVKRVRRLYNKMGLQTIYRAARTTIRNKAEYVYPYLLRNLEIEKPNQVWQTDITYIPMAKGFMYLTAIIDVHSRKIMGWSLSNSMTKKWCCDLVNNTIEKHGSPEVLNSDQGAQYTSNLYIELLKKQEIKISMDGKGRALDNIYIERFWRSIKYEQIYLNHPNNGIVLYQSIQKYMQFYNSERRHTELENRTPNSTFSQYKYVA